MEEVKDRIAILDYVESKLKKLDVEKASVQMHKKFANFCDNIFASKEEFNDYRREQRWAEKQKRETIDGVQARIVDNILPNLQNVQILQQ